MEDLRIIRDVDDEPIGPCVDGDHPGCLRVLVEKPCLVGRTIVHPGWWHLQRRGPGWLLFGPDGAPGFPDEVRMGDSRYLFDDVGSEVWDAMFDTSPV